MSETLTPSQQIVAEANATVTVTDAKGRPVEIRRLRGRPLARFIRACGAAADVQTYFGEAILRASVVSVDGKPIPAVQTPDQVDALWDYVDADAVGAAVIYFSAQADAKSA